MKYEVLGDWNVSTVDPLRFLSLCVSYLSLSCADSRVERQRRGLTMRGLRGWGRHREKRLNLQIQIK